MSFSKNIKAMSLDELEVLKKSLEAQLRDVRSAIKKHGESDGEESESSSKSSKKSAPRKKAVPRKPTAWAEWTKVVKEKYAKEYAKEAEKFKKAHDGKLAGGKGVGGFAIVFAKMMREKHDEDYAEFEAEVKSASASEASSDEKPAKKSKKPAKKSKAPAASAAAAAETDNEEEEEEHEEHEEHEETEETEVKKSELSLTSINGTKYAFHEGTKGCWTRNKDKSIGEWAGVLDTATMKLDTSAPEIRLVDE